MSSNWNDPFFMANWQKENAKKTKHSLGGASLSLWSLQSILDLAGPQEKQAWHDQKMQYTSIQGGEELRGLISQQYKDLSAENIVIFSGAQEALTCIYLALLDNTSRVIGLTPSYAPMTFAAQKTGAEFIEFPLTNIKNKWSLDFLSLNEKINKNLDMLIVNFPHNPTGFIPSLTDWQETLKIAEVAGTWVVCDEVFKGLEFNKQNVIPPVCDLLPMGVSVGSLSKAYGCPSTRIGWVATHSTDLISKVLNIKRYLSICPSRFDEAIAKIMIRNKEQVLDQNKSFIKNRYEYAKSKIKMDLSNWIDMNQISAGIVLFPSLKLNTSAHDFCKNFLAETGYRLEPGLCFGANHTQNFRLGLGGANLEQGLDVLESYFKGYTP